MDIFFSEKIIFMKMITMNNFHKDYIKNKSLNFQTNGNIQVANKINNFLSSDTHICYFNSF